ncbi:Bax inhibitor-1/YccA family protein [Candidatus Synchoanobacter obligatus]|uniref:Bax inhibitor-1/YccA family protein n=1 Tax=Candidatus Synchoanobacter obligatus TaxID=2919597 RepID=A0ABT1L5V3_9GAMM|nr:Bax inhibitor-1/YccA family protein [Candidatus Synchoanobacter obligatus]MCP8352565.1 Bax inhibitor-1/YccA family protein [Candidatus Synchoanobacter obligatus]
MNFRVHTATQSSHLETNSVLRNTYALLGLTLLFSAIVAWGSMILRLPHPGFLGMILGFYGLYFLTQRYSHSAMGVLTAFLFTGFLGYSLGPILGMVLRSTTNGYAILGMSLATTGVTFLTLSAYVLTTSRNFSYMGGMLIIGSVIAMLAAIASFFFPSIMMMVITSAVFALISAGYILFHTSQIIHGGETNYIMATVALFVSIYNLFLSLLRIFLIFSGQRD